MTTETTPMIGFDDERLARASLTYLAEPGDERLGLLTDAYGAAPVLEAIQADRLPGPPAPPGPEAVAAGKALERWRSRLDELPTADGLERLCRQGIRLVCPGDPEWPTRLDDLGAARPYALWLRGRADLRFSCLHSLSVVGSRAATAYGSYMASEIASSVAARGWTIVSGAAYGVDGSAHSGTLGAGGATVAVLACGVDRPYPVGHKDLLDAIAEHGVVASEWPPGRNPSRVRFLVRNRVIAALTAGTLVVEAGERSGALNTARHARDLGRRLMAVPGPVTSEQSRGCHTIIRDWNAILVTSADDVLQEVTPLGEVVSQAFTREAPTRGALPGGALAGEAPAGKSSSGGVLAGEAPTGGVPLGGAPPGRAPLGGASAGGALPGGALAGEAPSGDARPGDARPGEASPRAGALAAPAGRPAAVLPRDRLDRQTATVLDALPVRGGLGTTAVAAKAGLPPADVLRLLGELAAGGFAERCDRGWRVRRS